MERTQLESRELRLKSLFTQAIAGDAVAYRTLLEELMLILDAYYRRVLHGRNANQVSDLTQETLFAIHQKRSAFDLQERFSPWLFAIARYKLIDFIRKNRREFLSDDFQKLESQLIDEGSADDFSIHEDLHYFMSDLSRDHQEVLRLVKLEGHSLAEVSSQLGVSEAALKVRVFRAMKALQNKVKREFS
jgi:RNA polymerase sigma-70 factor (ECF subfamily)